MPANEDTEPQFMGRMELMREVHRLRETVREALDYLEHDEPDAAAVWLESANVPPDSKARRAM